MVHIHHQKQKVPLEQLDKPKFTAKDLEHIVWEYGCMRVHALPTEMLLLKFSLI